MGNWQKKSGKELPREAPPAAAATPPLLQLQLPFPFAVKASLGTETDGRTVGQTDGQTDQQQIVLFVPESITHLKYKTSR